MARHLPGRIAALWRRTALPGDGRCGEAAKETGTMGARELAGGIVLTSGRPAVAPGPCSGDLTTRAMTGPGMDHDALARRDVCTSNFQRRHRHRRSNAESLARIAAGRQGRTGSPRSTPPA